MKRKRVKALLGRVLAIALAFSMFPGVSVHATETEDVALVQEVSEANTDDLEAEGETVLDDDQENGIEEDAVDAKQDQEQAGDQEEKQKEVLAGELLSEDAKVLPDETATDEIATAPTAEALTDADDAAVEEGFVVTFETFEGGSYVAYDRQNFEEAVATEDAECAIARNSDTGEIDTTGSGQVNFSVVLEDGYAFDSIAITEGSSNYKNLKTVSSEGNVYTYRITKITGNLTVSVTVIKLDLEGERAILTADLEKSLSTYPKYYQSYCTAESAEGLTAALTAARKIDAGSAALDDIRTAIDNIQAAVADLQYKTAEVPQIYVSTSSGEGYNLSKSTGYIDTDVVIADVDGSILAESGQIKVRGNSTAYGEKKPYNIKFASKQNVLGMGSAKKWCLLANCFDASLLRNNIAFHIAQEMGIPYTCDNSYVEVWVDGRFMGCYLLTEAVEAAETRVDIKVKNGDFVLELEKSRVEDGATYITNDNGLRFSFKEPEEPTDAQFAHVKEVLDRVTAAIDGGDYSEVENVIDVESFAKFFVINEYMKNNDFNFSSTYFFYKNGKLYAGPVWDFDLSSGNGNQEVPIKQRYDNAVAPSGNWYPYLWKYSEFREAAVNTFDQYKGLFGGIACEGGYIDSVLDKYINVFNRNFNEAGWDPSKRYSTNQMVPLATFGENVDYLSDWLRHRLDWMDDYYHNLNPPHIWITYAAVEGDCVRLTWKEEAVDSYRVYRKEIDGTWIPISDVMTDNSFEDVLAKEGKEYYYMVLGIKNGKTSTYESKGKYVHVVGKQEVPIVITKQPENITLKALNKSATFKIGVTGKGINYMWYYRIPGTDTFIKSAVNAPEYSRFITASNVGMEACCVITDIYGNTVTSKTASVNLRQTLKIVEDTQDIEVLKINKKYTFRIVAEGSGLKYSWYYKRPGENTFYKAGVYTDEYTRTATEGLDGMQVYCIVTDEDGNSVVGRTATLIINNSKPKITYPDGTELSVRAGKRVSFTIEASSKDELSYKWYYKFSVESGGDGKYYNAGCYTNTYSRYVTQAMDGMQAYCVVTDSKGRTAVSDYFTLKVK